MTNMKVNTYVCQLKHILSELKNQMRNVLKRAQKQPFHLAPTLSHQGNIKLAPDQIGLYTAFCLHI